MAGARDDVCDGVWCESVCCDKVGCEVGCGAWDEMCGALVVGASWIM